MKKLLIAGVAALAFASVAMAASYTFSNNLTVGSTGADVTALQGQLIAGGYSIPAGATGYFGSQTKAAVMAYQDKNSIPNTGFVGPLTRAALNGGAMAAAPAAGCPAGYTCTATAPVATVTCPAGYTCTAANGTTLASNGTTVAGPTGITTPGVQGIMSVTAGPISASTAYAGNTKVPLLDARIQAQYSDLSVQSLTVDLGSSTSIYNYVYSKIYLIDPSTGNVLTSEPLNSSTVVGSGNNYVVGLAGFNFIVPKGTYKDIQVAADLYPTILTNYLQTWYVGIDNNGIRAVDGAGVNNYGPSAGAQTGVISNAGFSAGIAQGIVVSQNQTLSATANISLDGSTPAVTSVPITNLSAGTYLGLPVLVFDVNSQGDNLHLHNVIVNISAAVPSGAVSGGAVSAAYLYSGSTMISSAAVSGGVATFSNIADGTAGASIPINTTVPFTVKVDVSGLTATNSALNVTASTGGMTIYNSADSSVTTNGSASGNQLSVLGTGVSFSLSGTPTITKAVQSSDTNGNSTTTYTATFNVVAQAVGVAATFGLPSAVTTGAPSLGTSSTGANLAQLYVNGSPLTASNIPTGNTTIGAAQASLIAGYSQPSNTTLSSNGNNFTVGINQSVTIPVTYSFVIRNAGANTFGVQLQGIAYMTGVNATTLGGASATSTATSTFMSGQTTWRTASI